jgi:L-amino acid N-acyltransferase YncA
MRDWIRAATEADAAEIADIYRPMVESTAISFETEPPDAAEMRSRITTILASHQWLVNEYAGHIQGYAYSTPFHARRAYRWSVEVSVYVREGARGAGVGRALLTALIEDCRERGFVNVFAGIALPNDSSRRLFEALGFERVALLRQVGFKLGAWRDVGWWQLRLIEAPPHPPEPRRTR